MGGVPIGLQWEAIYPLIDRLGLEDEAWNDLHELLMSLESFALEVMREFAPKSDEKTIYQCVGAARSDRLFGWDEAKN